MGAVDYRFAGQIQVHALDVVAHGDLQAGEISLVEAVDAQQLGYYEFCGPGCGCAPHEGGVVFCEVVFYCGMEGAHHQVALVVREALGEGLVDYVCGGKAQLAVVFDLDDEQQVLAGVVELLQ